MLSPIEKSNFRVRTSQPHLCLRKWMREKAWECWLHRCFLQKREASAASARMYQPDRENSLSRSSHISSHGKTCGDVVTLEKVKPTTKTFTGVQSRKKRNTGCVVGWELFQRMARTFGVGPLGKKVFFGRFGIDKSQGKCKKQCVGRKCCFRTLLAVRG